MMTDSRLDGTDTENPFPQQIDEMVAFLINQRMASSPTSTETVQPASGLWRKIADISGSVVKKARKTWFGEGYIEGLDGLRISMKLPPPFADSSDIAITFKQFRIGYRDEQFYTDSADPICINMANILNQNHLYYSGPFEEAIEAADQCFTSPPQCTYDIDSQKLILTGDISPSRNAVENLCFILNRFRNNGFEATVETA